MEINFCSLVHLGRSIHVRAILGTKNLLHAILRSTQKNKNQNQELIKSLSHYNFQNSHEQTKIKPNNPNYHLSNTMDLQSNLFTSSTGENNSSSNGDLARALLQAVASSGNLTTITSSTGATSKPAPSSSASFSSSSQNSDKASLARLQQRPEQLLQQLQTSQSQQARAPSATNEDGHSSCSSNSLVTLLLQQRLQQAQNMSNTSQDGSADNQLLKELLGCLQQPQRDSQQPSQDIGSRPVRHYVCAPGAGWSCGTSGRCAGSGS